MSKLPIIEQYSNTDILALQVIERLKKMVNLPHHGVLGGGAVLSAIAEELKLEWINPVYNDIDIFYDTKLFMNEEELKNSNSSFYFKSSYEENMVPKFKHIRVSTVKNWDSSVDYDNYGNIKISNGYTYEILSSRRYGMINVINVHSAQSGQKFINELINSFDINSIQVAIDLKTKELCATSAFWKFLKTRQLEIEMFNTPNQSLIRLLKKRDEYGNGVYCNLEMNAQLVCIALNTKTSKGKFGIKAMNTAMRYVQTLNKLGYLIMQSNTVLGGYPTYYLEPTSDIIIKCQANLEGTAWNIYRLGHHNLVAKEIKPLFKIATAKKSFKESLYEAAKSSSIRFILNSKPSVFTDINIDKIKSKRYKAQFKRFDEHDKLIPLLVEQGVDEAVTFMDFLVSESKKRGSHVFGIAESKWNLSQFTTDEFSNYLDEEETKMSKNVIKEYGLKSFKNELYEVIELTTELELLSEGTYQQQCVGGYFKSIYDDRCRIVSIRDIKSSKRVTCEVNPVSSENAKSNFHISQAKQKRNVDVDEDAIEEITELITQLFEGKKYLKKEENEEIPF